MSSAEKKIKMKKPVVKLSLREEIHKQDGQAYSWGRIKDAVKN